MPWLNNVTAFAPALSLSIIVEILSPTLKITLAAIMMFVNLILIHVMLRKLTCLTDYLRQTSRSQYTVDVLDFRLCMIPPLPIIYKRDYRLIFSIIGSIYE